MNSRVRYQPPRDSGGSGGMGPRDGRDRDPMEHSPGEADDPFFKDPALHVGEDVARSLSGKQEPGGSGTHEVIHDAYTAEVPYDSETTDYDGASYGAHLTQMMKDKQRESDSRPKGIDAKELEAIYGKRWRSDDTFTMREGPPKREFSIWKIPGMRLLFRVAILAAIVFGLFAIRLSIVDEDGLDTTSPLPIWIYQQATMGSEQQMMQRLEPHERHFSLTLNRIRRVARAATEYELAFGTAPRSVEDLVVENMVLPSRVTDGWGNQFRIETHMEQIQVRSAGRDMAFHTDDDITVSGDSRPHFAEIHYSRESMGTMLD